MSLAKHGNKNNKNKKKTGGKPNPVGFTVKKKDNPSTEDDTTTEVTTDTDTSTEETTEISTDNSTEESTDTDISSLLRQQLAPAKKKGKKKQISAWIEEDTYKAFSKYKGNGEKGQKSDLVNKLLKIYFNIEDKE